MISLVSILRLYKMQIFLVERTLDIKFNCNLLKTSLIFFCSLLTLTFEFLSNCIFKTCIFCYNWLITILCETVKSLLHTHTGLWNVKSRSLEPWRTCPRHFEIVKIVKSSDYNDVGPDVKVWRGQNPLIFLCL